MQGAAVLILVVEDDQLVRDLVTDALSDGGFTIEVSVSGEDAVKLLLSDATKYRALITDINLFGTVDGWQVGHRARELNPDIPVIYMTGAAADQWSAHGVPNSILLSKPFAPAQIVAAVAQLLNTGAPPA
ncbi:response regulator [Bradyrhizobium sp. CW9]|uniref:response regulator n=1 Tax=Bradyrhizobium sp. CW9 TaxID=2782689 RepID=UPI001FF8DD83|nr:response regulator [Bradyrhizobium sp. CW9]MCK1333069.1 response regulator [Bradyrhizobium sp. CW9]